MRAGLAAAFLVMVPVLGAGTASAGVADACAIAQRSCAAQCDAAYPPKPDDMAHTGCLARCSWESATCAAKGALEDGQATLENDVKPWLSDQARSWQRFWDGFRNAPAPHAGPRERAAPPRSPAPEPDSTSL